MRGGFRQIAKREKPPRRWNWIDLVIVLALFATSASCSWALAVLRMIRIVRTQFAFLPNC